VLQDLGALIELPARQLTDHVRMAGDPAAFQQLPKVRVTGPEVGDPD
jgi:hypothetical protein